MLCGLGLGNVLTDLQDPINVLQVYLPKITVPLINSHLKNRDLAVCSLAHFAAASRAKDRLLKKLYVFHQKNKDFCIQIQVLL